MIGEKYREKIKYFDWVLFGCILILISLGLLVIFSITREQGTRFSIVFKSQIIYVILGFLVFFILSFQDYRIFKKPSKVFYGFMIFLLFLTLIWGWIFHLDVARWIDIGPFQFQPSEFAKVFFIIFLSWYFAQYLEKRDDLKSLFWAILLVGAPVILTAIQPDLGTSLVFLAIFVVMLLSSSVKKGYVFLMFLLGISLMPVFWHFLKDYQKARILTFLNPGADPLGSGYHVLQSVIAVGSGGLWGKGIGQGFQSQLKFLPAPYTDFIFAALAEELGFLGILFVLITFLILFLRMIKIAREAKDYFGRFLTFGALGMIVFQLLVNVGMNMGIMPVTGIPLPLISYGGSSLISTLFVLGIIESVAVHHKKIKF